MKKKISEEDLIKKLMGTTLNFHKRLDKIVAEINELWWEKSKKKLRKHLSEEWEKIHEENKAP